LLLRSIQLLPIDGEFVQEPKTLRQPCMNADAWFYPDLLDIPDESG
jgi:hypothetical protein